MFCALVFDGSRPAVTKRLVASSYISPISTGWAPDASWLSGSRVIGSSLKKRRVCVDTVGASSADMTAAHTTWPAYRRFRERFPEHFPEPGGHALMGPAPQKTADDAQTM